MGCSHSYKVRWDGYDADHDTWEKALHLKRDLGAPPSTNWLQSFKPAISAGKQCRRLGSCSSSSTHSQLQRLPFLNFVSPSQSKPTYLWGPHGATLVLSNGYSKHQPRQGSASSVS